MDEYKRVYYFDLDMVSWDGRLWKRYIRALKREYHDIEPEAEGRLRIWSSSTDITEFRIQVLVKSILSEVLDQYRPIRLEGLERLRAVVLPLDDQPESTTYLFYSTRLAILQTDERSRQWLLQYMMDLRLFYHPGYSNFLFLEEEMEQMMSIHKASYHEVEQDGGILPYVRTNILAGEYVNVHLDEFYIPQKDYYQTRHFVHENLIYGFDDEKQELYVYGIGMRQQTQKYIISYLDFLTAYEKGRLFYFCGAAYLEQEGYAPVQRCQIGSIPEYQFTWEDMQNKLSAYLHPKPENMEGEDIHVYGLDVYRWILRELTDETGYGIVDYRVFHLLYEHKCCIGRRMQYLQKQNAWLAAYNSMAEEYPSVIQAYQKMRLLYMKELRLEGKLHSPDKRISDKAVRKKLAELLGNAVEKEMAVLSF